MCRERTPATLGVLLATYRRTAGLTQLELATRAGLSLGAVRDLEQGRRRRPRPDSVARLAEALGLDTARASALGQAGGSVHAIADSADSAPAPAQEPAPAPTSPGIWIQLMGPLAVWLDRSPVALGGPGQQAVLALLALTPRSVVPRVTIIDMLWPAGPPANAVNVVQTYVSRLRRVLDPVPSPLRGGGLLALAGVGYRLQVEPDQLDLMAFGRLTEAARAADLSKDYELACSLFEQALALWHGDPLAGTELLRGHPSVTALARSRTETVLHYARAASAAGRHEQVLAPLWELAGREPLNEPAHAHLMIALAGSGRQAQALAVYERLRRRLDNELAMRPGPDLIQAHQRVLRQEVPATSVVGQVTAAQLAGPDPAPARGDRSTAAEGVVPRQLPAFAPSFTGRCREQAALGKLIDPAADTVVIAAITGTAGVGKTALAVHWAHRAAVQFPDGQIYINLRGFEPSGAPLAPDLAVREFLETLGVAAGHIPASASAQAGLYRSLVAGKRLLIVLDNARNADQVRPLLPGSPGCVVVVTSRNSLAGLAVAEGAQLLTLDLLTMGEARRLLARRLGGQRAAAEPGAIDELVTLCARLPLALAIAAARAADRPGFPLTALAAELRGAHSRLDAVSTGEDRSDLRTVFSWSYGQLSPAQARMFRLLGLHPGPDISIPAAGSLAGLPVSQAGQALAQLARACLISERAPGRYACHDLLRAYATEQARASDSEQDRRAAIGRVLDHYLYNTAAAALLYNPSLHQGGLTRPKPGVILESFSGHQQALEWFDAEHEVLSNVVRVAAEEPGTWAWQLPCALADFLDLAASSPA
jgi:DNA-binding SARP family transcriptional activator/transcriptional regulator with XRE-family HTH domain